MTPVTHRARWIMIEPGHFVENGRVTVHENRILDIGKYNHAGSGGATIDHGPGILMPALVNAHTHIALDDSARPLAGDGFIPWVEGVIDHRNRQSAEAAQRMVIRGIHALMASGTALVGEFGPHIAVDRALRTAGLGAIVWTECLGNDRDLPPLPEDKGCVQHAWAAHAPHTTSPFLLKRIQGADARIGRRFCLHLAESREEVAFLMNGKGDWADFMTGRGINFSGWDCFGKGPVQLALDLGLLDRNTLAVHLLEMSSSEMDALARTGAHVCLCPRSNWALHRKLPDIPALMKRGVNPAIGTDSLASVGSLSLFDEMRFIHERYPGLHPDTLLRFGTINGARALGYGDIGSIRPGNRIPILYVDLDIAASGSISEALVSTEMVTPKLVH